MLRAVWLAIEAAEDRRQGVCANFAYGVEPLEELTAMDAVPAARLEPIAQCVTSVGGLSVEPREREGQGHGGDCAEQDEPGLLSHRREDSTSRGAEEMLGRSRALRTRDFKRRDAKSAEREPRNTSNWREEPLITADER